MKVEYVPIFEDSLLLVDLDIDNNALYNECQHVRDTQDGVQHSNVGGYQSPALFKATTAQYTEMNNLIDSIQRVINGYVNKYNFSCNKAVEIGNFWLNFNEKKDMNDYHTHPHSVFSGAYYVKAPENCGTINFFRNSNVTDTEWGYFFSDSNSVDESMHRFLYRVKPRAGLLVLFPSYYPHSVSPNNSDEVRLSISFNSQAIIL